MTCTTRARFRHGDSLKLFQPFEKVELRVLDYAGKCLRPKNSATSISCAVRQEYETKMLTKRPISNILNLIQW